jgi:hypothetical protein
MSQPGPLGLSLIGLFIALGAAIAGANANAAAGLNASAAAPPSPTPWCIIQNGSSKCYENLFTCIIAGIAQAGSCTQRQALNAPSANAAAQQHPPPAPRRARVPKHNQSLTAAERETLFRDFVKWEDRPPGNAN